MSYSCSSIWKYLIPKSGLTFSARTHTLLTCNTLKQFIALEYTLLLSNTSYKCFTVKSVYQSELVYPDYQSSDF